MEQADQFSDLSQADAQEESLDSFDESLLSPEQTSKHVIQSKLIPGWQG